MDPRQTFRGEAEEERRALAECERVYVGKGKGQWVVVCDSFFHPAVAAACVRPSVRMLRVSSLTARIRSTRPLLPRPLLASLLATPLVTAAVGAAVPRVLGMKRGVGARKAAQVT